MFCMKCGANMADNAQFCSQCGTRPQPVNPSLTPNPPPPPPPGATVRPAQAPFATAPPAYGAPAANVPRPYTGLPETDGKAVGSLILGICSITVLPILASIPAVILGHVSRASIQKSMGRLKGEGMALAGLIMGYLSGAFIILIIAAIAIPNLIRARQSANEAAAAGRVRTIVTSEVTYNTTNAKYSPDLATLGPGPGGRCTEPSAQYACLLEGPIASSECTAGAWCTMGNYRFIVSTSSPSATDFVVVATPASPDAGQKSFCATEDGMVRTQRGTVSRLSGEECGLWPAI